MTAILAQVVENEGVWLACDSCVSFDDGEVLIQRGPKWWDIGHGVVIAEAGNTDVACAVRAKLQLRKRKQRETVPEWAFHALSPAIRAASGSEDGNDAHFMVVASGHVFLVDSVGGLLEPSDRDIAIGSHSAAARVGLSLSSFMEADPEGRLRLVLSRLECFTDCVRPPFWFKWVPKEEK